MIPISFLLCSLETEEERDKLLEIYERYLPLMTCFAEAIVGKYNAEEDVVHDTVIQLIRNLDKIDPGNDVKTREYIRRVTISRSIDWLRREKHSMETEDIDDPRLGLEDDSLPPVDQIILGDGYDYLVQCIRSLKDTYRLVCEMRLIDKMSNEQIAEKLGITAKNVSARYARGIRQLKIMVRDGGYYDEQIGK